MPFNATSKKLKLLAEFLSEMGTDFFDHTGFGSCRKTKYRWHWLVLLFRKLAYESGGVKIVRPKIVPPFRETVRLIEHPATNFTLFENISDTNAAQLFR